MFTAKKLMFLYAVTPVHMGAGTAIGVIDNPIQRERHTEHPVFAGSGIKGALRDHAFGETSQAGSEWTKSRVRMVFGPADDLKERREDRIEIDHAGAASFADAQVVAFPVRSLKEGYVYATSPYALRRLARLAEIAGVQDFPADALPEPTEAQAVVLNDKLLAKRNQQDMGRLMLESYVFDRLSDNGALEKVAKWLGGANDESGNALPRGKAHDFFRKKLAADLVLLHDTQFSFFVRNSTAVEPHVRIDDASGTADDGGLFFTENLPPESLMVSLAMASVERRRRGDSGVGLTPADEILKHITASFDGNTIQIGGDATTGRGQVIVHFAGDER